MTSEYGNVSWQFFVYSAYSIVFLSLVIYIILSLYSLRQSLNKMQQEGYFDETE